MIFRLTLLATALLLFTAAGYAQLDSYRSTDLTFTSMDVDLEGTLFLPDGDGPFPLLVGAHGSGRIDRSDLYQREVAGYLVPRGVAFFMFDKRGSGQSGGKYPGSYSSSMITYAVDVLSAARMLSQRSDIDSDAIGLWGVSQAGWVIPAAAAMDQELIDFVVIVSGPTVSINEENAYSDLTGETARRPSGMAPDEIDKRMRGVPSLGIDAAAFIAELRVPSLWIYGALDQSVPWRQGVEDLQALKAEWGRDFTWKVFPNANHGLRRARTGGPWERPVPREPVDGYLEFMAEWLGGHVGLALLAK